MKLAPNASLPAVGAFLMGYGVITPCRQRPVALSGRNSRALVSQAVPKVFARPEDVFRVLGFVLAFASIVTHFQSLQTCSVSTTASNSRKQDFFYKTNFPRQP